MLQAAVHKCRVFREIDRSAAGISTFERSEECAQTERFATLGPPGLGLVAPRIGIEMDPGDSRRNEALEEQSGGDAIGRLGIMGRNHAAGERDIGEVLAKGVEPRVGRVGRTGKREPVSAGERKRAPVR